MKSTNIKLQDRIPGKVYYMIGKDGKNVWTRITRAAQGTCTGDSIYLHRCEFTAYPNPNTNSMLRTDIKWEIREATPQEEEWLEQCKEAGKYVEYEPKILNYEIY